MVHIANKYTEAQKKATLKYQADKVKIQLLVTPDQRETYRAMASAKGMSLQKYITSLLEETKND